MLQLILIVGLQEDRILIYIYFIRIIRKAKFICHRGSKWLLTLDVLENKGHERIPAHLREQL